MIDERIKSVKQRLVKVKKQRQTQRRARERNQTFRISLVGYTNAGKSTLFNHLVKANAYAADQLFATLDTTTRQFYLEEATGSISLSDTVGFIRELPHKLVQAFEATLQEAADADLLLHVVDAGSPQRAEQMVEVQRVLHDIGAGQVPQLVVFNKADLLEESELPRDASDIFEIESGVRVPRVFVSAASGFGIAELRRLIAEAVNGASGTDLNQPQSPRSEVDRDRPEADSQPGDQADFPIDEVDPSPNVSLKSAA